MLLSAIVSTNTHKHPKTVTTVCNSFTVVRFDGKKEMRPAKQHMSTKMLDTDGHIGIINVLSA
jgi:hypothetical protein